MKSRNGASSRIVSHVFVGFDVVSTLHRKVLCNKVTDRSAEAKWYFKCVMFRYACGILQCVITEHFVMNAQMFF